VAAGLFFVGVLRNGLVVTDTSQFLQQVFVGAILIAAVALDDKIRQFVQQRTNPRTSLDQPAE
jgi:ribose transport system permease protein